MTITKREITRILFISLMVLIFAPSFKTAAHANGQLIVPEPPDGRRHFQPLILEREEINVTIDGQVARTHITQVWRNNNGMMLEGEFLFPLPTDRATMSDFVLWMDGNKLTFETLDAGKARGIYENIVRQMRDPGLLEYAGDGLLKCRIFPIPANGTKEIELEYREILVKDGTLHKYAFPLEIRNLPQPIGTLLLDVDITSSTTMGRVYSPTHDVGIDMRDANHAQVTLEKSNYRPSREFALYITHPTTEFGVDLITHKVSGDDGYFIGLISPRFDYDTSKTKPIPKDFMFILDTSGSMEGKKIVQAKDALKYILKNLNSDDRFGIIDFSTDVNKFRDNLASRSSVNDALSYVDKLSAVGGTNIDGALKDGLAFAQSGSNRPFYVIFLTDGLPTIGEQNITNILKNAKLANERDARIFAFGVGDDVNIQLIDKLAKENGGDYANAAPDEDIEIPLSNLYQKIKSPVLTDLNLAVTGVNVYDVYPKELPDLFKGSQLIVTGRYSGSGNANVKLTGKIGGASSKSFDYKMNFKRDCFNNFVPPLWANRKVGYLLNQIRLYGQNDEMIDQVTKLAKEFGIITPYTSYLVLEDSGIMPMTGEWEEGRDFMMDQTAPAPSGSFGGGGGGRGGVAMKGGRARNASKSMQKQESLGNLAEMEDDKDGESGYGQMVQQVQNKTFVQKGKYWIDTALDDEEEDKLKKVKIEFMSEKYFDLLDKYPEIGDYLSVGENVQIVWDSQLFIIESDEKDGK